MFSIDNFIVQFDRTLRTMGGLTSQNRPNPADKIVENSLSPEKRAHSAGLMRVNHVGEVCAQALYQAQGQFAKNNTLKTQFAQSAHEEEDHLAWTAQRLKELDSRPSLLNPLWYGGAYTIGAVAAHLGDAWSLGFVVETERQVEAHLDSHLDKLAPEDAKSRAIVDQMKRDEAAHGAAAQALGAFVLPAPVQLMMRGAAKVMTTTAYYV
jgi:ubiquinone biosynthesis monooxygenase Coq7